MDIKAPTFPESISEGTVAVWHKRPGQAVARDDLLVDIETDKVVLEVVAPANGTLTEILKDEGETVESEELIARFEAAEVELPSAPPEPVAETGEAAESKAVSASPAARKLAEEEGIDMQAVAGTGKSGRVTREDVTKAVAGQISAPVAAAVSPAAEPRAPADEPITETAGERVERRVPMTRLRASIARRLVEAQQNAAMLTTFNEVDMQPIMTMRKRYQEEFQARHNGTRLGFMSFFVRAAVESLKRFPAVNASIDGDDIIYHGFYDIGVAVSTDRGLVVPVVRDADALSLAQIEDQINEYGG